MPLTDDVLLICIFGGIINGFAISLCLLGRATSGGTDFIAVAVSERMNVDAWNYVLLGNAAMLAVAGFLFGWDKALYSIVFQFASTQIVHMLNPRYKRTTLFIISDKSEDIYEQGFHPPRRHPVPRYRPVQRRAQGYDLFGHCRRSGQAGDPAGEGNRSAGVYQHSQNRSGGGEFLPASQ